MGTTPHAAVVAKANERDGLLARADAVAVGVTQSQLRWLSRAGGPLVRLHRDVWALRDRRLDDRTIIAAALLQVGPLAAACRRSAGALHGLDACEAPEVDVWVARNRRVTGIRLARTIVHPSALREVRGVLATEPVTTLMQLGAVVPVDDVEAALESALHRQLVTVDQLRCRLGWCGATGLGVLREVLDRRPDGAPPTESLAETRFLQLARRSSVLPVPERQVELLLPNGRRARPDFRFGGVLHVEVVGRKAHERSTLADRRRLNAVSGTTGLPVCWFTWDDVVEHPEETLLEVEAAYRAARGLG